MKTLYLITGPSGVGKTTISEVITACQEKSVLIEGDDIYRIVKGGYVPPYKTGNHLTFFWKNIFSLIKNSLEEGYDVVFNYIIHGVSLKNLKAEFSNYKIKFVILIAKTQEIIARDKARNPDWVMGEKRIKEQLSEFEEQHFDKKYYLNTSKLTPVESAKAIIGSDNFLV